MKVIRRHFFYHFEIRGLRFYDEVWEVRALRMKRVGELEKALEKCWSTTVVGGNWPADCTFSVSIQRFTHINIDNKYHQLIIP